MTTKNITGIAAARRAVAATADSARDRHRAIAEKAAEVVAQRDADNANFEVARRASEQQHNDTLSELGHELEQTSFIVGEEGGTDEPEAPATGDAEPSAPLPATPAAPAVEETREEQSPTGGPVAIAIAVNNNPNPLNPRYWHGWTWFWFVVGAVVGALVASMLWGWFVQSWFWSHGPNWMVAAIILTVAYWIGLILGGGFTAAGIALNVQDRRPVPPENPAAPAA